MKDKMFSVKNDRVAGIVPPLVADHDIRFFPQKMDDLAFAFVTPLDTDYDEC